MPAQVVADSPRWPTACPAGQARVLVGNDVLLIQEATGLILDILSR